MQVIYEFAMYVTWVAFNYEHWKMLHNELGRVFRTMAFNRDCRFSSDGEHNKAIHTANVQRMLSRCKLYNLQMPMCTLKD